MVRPLKAGNCLKIGNWSVFVLFEWRFVFGIIMRWEGREPFLQMPSRLWDYKAASLLSFAKVTPRTCLIGKPAWGLLIVT